MAMHTMNMFLFMQYEYLPDYRDKAWQPDLWSCKVDESESRIFIKEMTVEIEVPDDFDPVPRAVAALEAEKRAAMAEYQQKVASINERLSKLQALTFEAAS